MSAKQPTFVLRNLCLKSPKHQSGANLVWPTNIKDISILLLSPARTRHARSHHITIFVLAGTVVSVEAEVDFPEVVMGEKVVQEADGTVPTITDVD